MARTHAPHRDEESTSGARARPPAPAGRRRLLVPLLAAVLLAQMAFAMVTAAVQQTPTVDEPVYVATAAEYLHEHRVRHNPEHPPLGKLVVAAGVALARPHVGAPSPAPRRTRAAVCCTSQATIPDG